MSIRKGKAAGPIVIGSRQIVPPLWIPIGNVWVRIGFQIAVIDAVRMFIEQNIKVYRTAYLPHFKKLTEGGVKRVVYAGPIGGISAEVQ